MQLSLHQVCWPAILDLESVGTGPSSRPILLLFARICCVFHQGRVVQSRVKIPRVSARFEFRFESLKSISVIILFVYKLMIGSSKNSGEYYPRKCFWTQKKQTRVIFKPGLSAKPPFSNWVLVCTKFYKAICFSKIFRRHFIPLQG